MDYMNLNNFTFPKHLLGPLTITDGPEECAVMLPPALYKELERGRAVLEMERIAKKVSADASEKGLTDEKLSQLLS